MIEAFHASPIGGHSGTLVTYNKARKFFIWQKMKGAIQKFVVACTVCQQAKTERVPYLGLLQPLVVPDQGR